MSLDKFVNRHIGPTPESIEIMLQTLGVKSVDDLIYKTIPDSIKLSKPLNIPEGVSEYEYYGQIKKIAQKNKVFKSYIGKGYYNTIFPAAIQRNILENPVWYTSYTPYQAEISQGRLEALLNFQTVITELTQLKLANASLLDEATAASEAMIMMYNLRSRKDVKAGKNKFFVDTQVFQSTKDVLNTRAVPLNIELVEGSVNELEHNNDYFGILVQYPNSSGEIIDYKEIIEIAHQNECLVAVAADILSLVLLQPPGEIGADIAVGTTQRFGIPMGFGGPHAAYFATHENFKRNVPGRIIGVSVDKKGNRALRMALQTREQHIKREKATSNICTAQALLATMAGMYAVYHGREGLKRIARHVHKSAQTIKNAIVQLGYTIQNTNYFDTLIVNLPENIISRDIQILAIEREINLNYINDKTVGISFDETVNIDNLNKLLEVFAYAVKKNAKFISELAPEVEIESRFLRSDKFLDLEVFNKYQSETELMRYIKILERKDFSLTHSMISLGSCTMKLNAAIELLPLSWSDFGEMHPYAPLDQTEGYQQIIYELGKYLSSITGFDAVSFQPNSGAAGEYAGLMVIREYLQKKGEDKRDVVLIPASAHGTNPASAVMAGYKVVVIKCDEKGNIDMSDIESKLSDIGNRVAALMVTYPSTHGVFETNIKEIIGKIHQAGGQVYMDGANMNAQVGLTNPATIGADVCHLNLHKTFAIPHGGGGPGVGPIAVASHLVEFLPVHSDIQTGGVNGISAISASPYGSASILTISHAYIRLLGADGLTYASKIAILNANYLKEKLKDYYDILYTGDFGNVAHEMILDCRPIKVKTGITEADIAKRLMDYGFHAPTLSFPVPGTLMIEPTESESLDELDRFIEAMISIYKEIEHVQSNNIHKDNILVNAPHTLADIVADEWDRYYTRQEAVYPLEWVRRNKLFPAVNRIDDAYGDRNLMCTCAPLSEYEQ